MTCAGPIHPVDETPDWEHSRGKALVTGATTGHLGRITLQLLRDQVPADDLAGLARNPAADLAELGVEVRQGDYSDYDSLVRAFTDVERLLLVSAAAFTDRNAEHFNAISAARHTDVKHLIFTAV